MLLCWSPSPFSYPTCSSLPNSCLSLRPHCGVLSLPSFPVHSCPAQRTSSSRSNQPSLSERNPALIFEMTTEFPANHKETIKPSLQEQHICEESAWASLGEAVGPRLCPADGTSETLCHYLPSLEDAVLQLSFLYPRSKKWVAFWAHTCFLETSACVKAPIHVSKLCLVPGTSLECNLARISRLNRKKVLACVSFRLTHMSGPDPKPESLLAGWRAVKGHGAGEKESSLLLQTWFQKWVPFIYKIKENCTCPIWLEIHFLGERWEKDFFNYLLQSFLGNCPTVGSPYIDKWHLWLNFWVNRDIYEGLLFFLLVDLIHLQPELA